MNLDSAIAPHLRCPRTRNRSVGDDYVPMFPGYTVRPSSGITQVVMANFGVQTLAGTGHDEAWRAVRRIVESFRCDDGPEHCELAAHVDGAGYSNFVAMAFWSDPARQARWQGGHVEAWWGKREREHDGLGYFQEILSPRIERYETLLSDSDRAEGAGTILGGITELPIREHGYWGSSRDRMPFSQTDEMAASGRLAARRARTGRVVIEGHDNLAYIRSGQDWADADENERTLYLRYMERPLRAGMDFLERDGASLGCYASRYMRHVDTTGASMEKSFGMGYWRSLADMEAWAAAHPTHKAIVGAFPPVGRKLNFELKLRLYHEVAVLKACEQAYEYINCHAATGLAGALSRMRDGCDLGSSTPRTDARGYMGKPAIPMTKP